MGSVPEEILYDRMKTVWLGSDQRGEIVWHPGFLDFARHRERAWLNDYFSAMSEVIAKNGGFLNKFIGEGIMVIFGVPLSEGVEKDARRAVQTALDMLQRIEQINGSGGNSRPPLEIGIRLHTGPLAAGSVGARERMEYSVIGETVNLASRLEALTKDYKVGIAMSPATHQLVKDDFETQLLGETVVRGGLCS